IEQIDRRVLRGERIPHEAKVFSIFEPHTELSFLMRRQEKIAPVLIMRSDITKRGSTGSLKK
ncbi:MAG: hypothetical protein KZQ63_16395, partial [Candidatus Thiodiazotropha sp. (ex Lucinoma aequizonata)]|nr:hypothetical protein [Candidatus Thiodiazotropha sp. (ex Lucinoma aequizonata)]